MITVNRIEGVTRAMVAPEPPQAQRGQRQSGMAALVSLGTQLLLAGICAPVLFLSRWTGNPWLPAEVFAFLAAATILGYTSTLDPLARLAEQKKETLIDALSR